MKYNIPTARVDHDPLGSTILSIKVIAVKKDGEALTLRRQIYEYIDGYSTERWIDSDGNTIPDQEVKSFDVISL